MGSMNLSIRGRQGMKLHLGEITQNIAKRNGGFGGGHRNASGASIPKRRIEDFIKELSQTLEP
jgi:nanoRNase/pAp phosphatase (c-di-AMP/oligoRNAs hydrolase)